MSDAIPVVAMPPLGRALTYIWHLLLDLADEVPGVWCLIGGQMVALHGLERGRTDARPSADGDVLADIRADPTALHKISNFLISRALQPDPGPDGILHRFKGSVDSHEIQVDVLALALDHVKLVGPHGTGTRRSLGSRAMTVLLSRSQRMANAGWTVTGEMLNIVELLIAVNPDPDSKLPYLLRLPLAGGMVLRTSGTWPRTKALYCYPVPAAEWPGDAEIVERLALRSCVRRGAAIDLVVDRARENRSQLVFTTAHGRDAVFWQSPRTRRQARPNVRTPTARAGGITDLQIVVDSHEQYAYHFTNQQVTTVKRALPCGDYAITVGGRLVASVERKSLADLVASLTSGKLRYAMAELAAIPRAAVVVEDRYSAIFKLDRVRPALVADGLAELQVRWPDVPIVFCETRQLAEEWTYRFLAAAHAWAETEDAAIQRIAPAIVADLADAPAAPEPSISEVRAWARSQGITVPGRGKLRAEIWDAWRIAHHQGT